MNNRVIITILFVFLCSITLYSQDYYWNKGEKVSVKKSNHKNYYLFFDANKTVDNLEINSTRVFNKELHWALGKFEGNKLIKYVSPAVINSNNDTLNFSNLFYVKLKEEKDIALLEKMAKENNVEILGNDEFMPLWFTLSCTKNSTGNALEMANLFYESKIFYVAEVDFLVHYKVNCVNDTYFNDQWNLRNTGQYGGTSGIDINYCAARNITTGNPNVVIAVLDQGIQRNHPDITNIHPLSFDAQTNTSPSRLYFDMFNTNHGTPCAGIIGANTNSSIQAGVAGIAPNCRLMDVSHSLQVTPNVHQELARGINWAWRNGAAVISNSWGHSFVLNSNLIDNAIDSALIRGRQGRGTIVVFSSGNGNSNVLYPANSNPGIIAVGAMSPCGERKSPNSCDGENWGSSFGNELDIVAPGVLVPTTDVIGNNLGINPNLPLHPLNGGNRRTTDYTDRNYTAWFNGTSAACPQVAGVAALILSVNPNLTQRQVKGIIERTAQKVRRGTGQGQYNYQNIVYPNTVAGRPNGEWHIQMGYGLVNAHAAVLQARDYCSLPLTTFSGITVIAPTAIDGNNVTISNVTVAQGQKLTVDACNDITITNVTVNSGATLELRSLNSSVSIDFGTFTVEAGATFIIW